MDANDSPEAQAALSLEHELNRAAPAPQPPENLDYVPPELDEEAFNLGASFGAMLGKIHEFEPLLGQVARLFDPYVRDQAAMAMFAYGARFAYRDEDDEQNARTARACYRAVDQFMLERARQHELPREKDGAA